MNERLNQIVEYISQIESVQISGDLKFEGLVIKGRVSVEVENTNLNFDIEIFPQYPLQFHDTETIRFINKELIEYNHVNSDGSICIHTLQSIDLKSKIEFDFNSLGYWIRKFYINKEVDSHYEHIIVKYKPVNGFNTVYLFTDVEYIFRKGQFGHIKYSKLSQGFQQNEKTYTNIVQSFIVNKTVIPCKWSKNYQNFETLDGIFLFIENPPVQNKRFAISSWSELEPHVNQDFFDFLYNTNKSLPSKNRHPVIPLLLGYKINNTEIHWQSILILTNSFPNYSEKVQTQDRQYIGKFYNQEIIWAETRNISYQHFLEEVN